MQGEELFTDAQFTMLMSRGGRVLRGATYAAVAYILLQLNTYGVGQSFYLPLAIGLLGAGSSSAKIAQLSIAVLLFMAVVPLPVFGAVRLAMG